MTKLLKKRPWGIVFPLLVLAFLVSILARWPQLNRPLSKHHEFCTAMALRVMQVWDEGGITNYNFNPAMNFVGEENAFINNHASASGRIHDSDGNYYYISHPPLAYYVPFGLFKLLGADFSVANLQAFNLFLHFLSGLIVFFIALVLTGGQKLIPAFSAYLTYLFNPATLWFQGNAYMSDMMVQPFFALGVLVVVLIGLKERFSPQLFFLVTITIFAMVYTTWLGCFFALAAFLFGFIKWPVRKKKWGFLIGSFIGVGAALALFFWQYSSINGSEAVLDEWFNRVKVRTGFSSSIGSIFFLKGFFQNAPAIAFNYLSSYASVLLVLVPLMSFVLVKKVSMPPGFKMFSVISVGPILLLHLFLSDYSGHDFTTLWFSVFLAVTVGILLKKILLLEIAENKRLLFRSSLVLLVVLGCMAGTAQFHYINKPGEVSLKGHRYDREMKAGLKIAEAVSENEVAFVMGEKPTPQLVFYAHKNLKQTDDPEQAKKFLQHGKLPHGKLFHINSEYEIFGEEEIEAAPLN